MSILDTVRRAKAHLQEHGRVSLRVLKREFGLDDEALEELVEELVDIQQVAAREGKALAWVGPAGAAAGAAATPEWRRVPDPPPKPLALAERRQLTVLFCDLVDSTELASGLDPEDWREVVRSFQRACAEAIQGFAGHVAQYLGDGLLVYFGWPQAHEDDPERAVRAGLRLMNSLGDLNPGLQEKHGVRLDARVGIHTGHVVVGEMGAGERRETLALGETANVAARLKDVAEPGGVVLSGATLRLVQGIFVTRDLGTRRLKGASEPVHVHAAMEPSGVRSRLDVGADRLTPFVGREHELRLLLDRWERVLEGEGQAVLLLGEAGVGKSRLSRMLRERLAEQSHTWLECRSSSYTRGSALSPVIQLVEEGLAFAAKESAGEKLIRLEAGVSQAGLDPGTSVPLIAELLGLSVDGGAPLGLSPELQRERTLEALTSWALGLSRIQPLLLLMEDLHWCDPSSIELFGRLLEEAPVHRVLMVLTARPEFHLPWERSASWTTVPLGRLGRQQAELLVSSITRQGALPREVVEEIVERADGVPLYLEELARAAVEAGPEGASHAVPVTLRDSLTARLDRLGPSKEVAHLASVLGREFSYDLLRRVGAPDEGSLVQALEGLERADLLFRRGTPPEATYTFKHALIQETAYESMLRRTRRGIHARVARVLEARSGEPELVARHYEAAGLIAEAIAHYRRAGVLSAKRTANREALALLRRGLDLVGRLPAGEERDHRELELHLSLNAPVIAAEGYGSPAAGAANERASVLAEHLRDEESLFRALWGLRSYQMIGGNSTAAQPLCERLVEIAERQGSADLLLMAHVPMGAQLYWTGRPEQALWHLERAREHCEPGRGVRLGEEFGQDPVQSTWTYRAMTLWHLGQADRSLESLQQGLEVGRDSRVWDFATALCWAAVVRYFRREPERAWESTDELIRISRDYGFPAFDGFASFMRGWQLAVQGDHQEAMGALERGLARIQGSGVGLGGPTLTGALAEIHWMLGRTEQAAGLLDAALAIAERSGQTCWVPEIHRLKGELDLERTGDADEAETRFRTALDLARRQPARLLELRAATSLARLWQRRGRRHGARELLQPVYAGLTEGRDTPDLIEAKALLHELS